MLGLRRREAPAGIRYMARDASSAVVAKTSEERIVKVDVLAAGAESPHDASLVACQQRRQPALWLVRSDGLHSNQERTYGGRSDDERADGCQPTWIGRIHRI